MPTLKARFTAAVKAIRFPALMTGGWYGGYGGHNVAAWGNRAFDFASAAGDPLDNSIVGASIGWIGRTFPEAPVRVMRETAKGREPVPAHPLTLKLRRPNPYESMTMLWPPLITSYITDGNAYLLKERTNGGDVLNLWYVPHWTMEPRWSGDGLTFIDHYDYRVDGQTYRYAVEDVIHLRNGKDPRNTRKGLSQLKSVIREIASDNLALQYSAAMLQNYGTPGAIISPGFPDGEISDADAAAIKQDYKEKTTGTRRGEPLIAKTAVKVDIPSFSPQQMNVRESQYTPEERVSAVIGVPAIVVGLGAGLNRSTFSNYQQSREAAYDSYLIPTQTNIADQLTMQLLPDFSDDPAEMVAFDYAEVRALSEDANALAERAVKLYSGSVVDRWTAKTIAGEEPDTADKGKYFLPRGGAIVDGEIAEPITAQSVQEDTAPGATPATPAAPTNGHTTQPIPAAKE